MAKVLLVTPVFHQYHAALAAAIAANGHEVVTHLYDRDGGLLGRLENRLIHVDKLGLRQGLRRLVTERAVAALRQVKPDMVVVVKGDVLEENWWQELHATATAYVLWIYDELHNTAYTEALLRELNAVVSYSAVDTASLQKTGISAGFVPGGFDSLGAVANVTGLEDRVTFIGARYPQREALLNQLHSADVKLTVYGGQWASSLWDRARTGKWDKPAFETRGDIARDVSYGVMENSFASINQHGNHSGFNMRMFEACGVGGVHLVDRTDAAEYYEPGTEILTFTNGDEAIEHLALLRGDKARAARIREAARKRTLAEHTLIGRMKALLARVN